MKPFQIIALLLACLPASQAREIKFNRDVRPILSNHCFACHGPDEKQRKAMCFAWDHVDPKRGLLRTRIENNWRITNPIVASNFYNKDQQALIRGIFEGMTSPDWHGRFDQQLKDDVGGFGKQQSIAIFGEPGSGKFQFVLTSRHMTLRCDGDSAEHVAFGGPILYAHEGERLYEKPDHPKNVF